EHVAFGVRRDAREFIGGQVPDGVVVATDWFRQVLDRNWKGAPARTQHRARLQVSLQEARIQSCGHDGEFQIETRGCLELESASESDVTIEMAFMKFVEKDGGDAAQQRILNELAQ